MIWNSKGGGKVYVVVVFLFFVHFSETQVFHLNGHIAAITPIQAHHASRSAPAEIGNGIFHFYAVGGPFGGVRQIVASQRTRFAVGGTEKHLQSAGGFGHTLIIEGEHALVGGQST